METAGPRQRGVGSSAGRLKSPRPARRGAFQCRDVSGGEGMPAGRRSSMIRRRPASRRRALCCVMLAGSLGLGGCAGGLAPSSFDGAEPVFRPEAFFAGTTRSTGVLQNRSGAPTQRFRVEGMGELLQDGSFRLEQRVSFGADAPTMRTWLLRRVDPHRYTATLTDAAGPVRAEAYGDLLHLEYAMKSPFGGWMEQWMYLQPDGRTVLNEATITVFGVVVARVSERIAHIER